MGLTALLEEDEPQATYQSPVEPDAYDRLPESIKCSYSRKEWLWLSDRDKYDLVGRETEPEYVED